MRILHLCLSNFYVDGFAYQENELVQQNVKDGHDVEVIASTEVIDTDGRLRFVEPGRYMGADGAIVERVPYRGFAPKKIMSKLRMHPGIGARISAFAPDVVLFHCACGWELNAVGRYVRDHPQVVFYVDSHEDFINSARNFVSKWLLHWAYYRPILRRNLRYVTKVLPVALSALEFMRDFYGVPAEKLELYPLGGFVPDNSEYAALRKRGRAELGVSSDQILIVQSGKIDATKKLIEALEAFTAIADPALCFMIPGLVQPDVEARINALVASDPRIHLLGWKSPDELRMILAAADVYCQPGTQSATMQMSIANRCAILLDDIPGHRLYLDGNGWLVGQNRTLADAFAEISSGKGALAAMAERSHQVALRMLDYRLLAARLYEHR